MTVGAARTAADIDELFAVLADPTRRAVVARLVAQGPASATVLAADFPVTRQAVVKHLQALEAVGLVMPERVGREVRYRADPAPLGAVVAWLVDAGASWDRRVDRLQQAARRQAVAAG